MAGRVNLVLSHLFSSGRVNLLCASKRFLTHSAHFTDSQYDYDFAVIGGGSGGLSAAKYAAANGAKVALFDYVETTPHGSHWGLGGTCVNVGCIPKKLFHSAALYGEALDDITHFGWQVNQAKTLNWYILTENVNNFIKSVNFAYRVTLRKSQVQYLTARARFSGPHTLEYLDEKGNQTQLSAAKILIAVGGKPNPLNIPGGELAITSDDIFQLPKAPGKTLVVGAGYIALECAGFLTGYGYDTSVLVRSVPLRGFDTQVVGRLVDHMKFKGTHFLNGVPESIEKLPDDTLRVRWKSSKGTSEEIIVNTVLAATGRFPRTEVLNLDKAGVQVNPANQKVIVNQHEQTSNPDVFCVGDSADGRPELTPVAVQAGKLLSERLFGGRTKLMNYNLIPTTVFTPMEYGTIGLTEQAAISHFGEENIEVYHMQASPYEQVIIEEKGHYPAYVKLITNKLDNERIVGFHVLAPNAGEITQGFSLGMNLGATKQDFDDTVGIHPTTAELFTTLTITKRSGEPLPKGGCPSCS